MTPRFEFRCLMFTLATCLCTSNLFADDAPPAPNAPSAEQGPKITPGPSAPKPNATEPVPEFQPWAADPNFPEYAPVPFVGFNLGYGYRPLGYAFWPRYGDYSNFADRYFMNPYQFYRQPYMWRSYEALPPYLQAP